MPCPRGSVIIPVLLFLEHNDVKPSLIFTKSSELMDLLSSDAVTSTSESLFIPCAIEYALTASRRPSIMRHIAIPFPIDFGSDELVAIIKHNSYEYKDLPCYSETNKVYL